MLRQAFPSWSRPVLMGRRRIGDKQVMDRRNFVLNAIVGLSVTVFARAQGRRVARVGWVGGWYSVSAANGLFEAFRKGMRELGYVEGQNVTIDARWMEGTSPDEAATLSAELV